MSDATKTSFPSQHQLRVESEKLAEQTMRDRYFVGVAVSSCTAFVAQQEASHFTPEDIR